MFRPKALKEEVGYGYEDVRRFMSMRWTELDRYCACHAADMFCSKVIAVRFNINKFPTFFHEPRPLKWNFQKCSAIRF